MKRARLDSDDSSVQAKHHLFISLHPGDHEMHLSRFAYTQGTNDKVFEDVRDFVLHVKDGEKEYEEPLYALFVYLCGKWKGARPPSSLLHSFWALPLSELGTWEELPDGSLPFVDKTQWESTTYFVARLRHEEDEDMIDEYEWKVFFE
jgi:1,2-phenylacetyl-CoA epoxidase PaaB subunit